MQGEQGDSSGFDMNKIVSIIKVQVFVFFAFAYCTKKIYDEDICIDDEKEIFLNRAFYANMAVLVIVLIGIFITKVQSLQTFLNKCGAVFVTLQICLFQGSLIISHFFFMVYSIQQHFWSPTTKCREIQLFLMVYAYVSIVWIFLQIYEGLLRLLYKIIKPKQDYSLDNQGSGQPHYSSQNYNRM